jgi:hypothetical protein
MMGDESTRAALVAFFSTPAITGIQKFYQDMPWFIDGKSWKLFANNGWGSIAFIHLDTAFEDRIAINGATAQGMPQGKKTVRHTVSIVIQYQYLIPPTMPTGQVEDAWVGPLDQTIDLVKARLRSDPAMGTGVGGVIFQAAQQQNDIRQTRDLPVTSPQGSKVMSWNRIEFDVTEIITA